MSKPPHIAVFGDIMLDVFEQGTANRLSPEAPVVVLLNPTATAVLGGAANTAANAQSLGAVVSLGGCVGDDAAGEQLIDLIQHGGMTPLVAKIRDVPTTVKRRFLAGNHQIMRLDVESSELPVDSESQLVEVWSRGPAADAIVLSDYEKGAITASVAAVVIQQAQSAGIPVIVDSKKPNPRCFAGCTVIAPNHLEAAAMTGASDPRRAAEIIRDSTKSAVLVTLGAQGMLIHDEHGFELIPSHAIEVSDVTGAGDTVTAALAVALSEGASVREAARWANHAAAVAVAHAGTYAVPREAILPIYESKVGLDSWQ